MQAHRKSSNHDRFRFAVFFMAVAFIGLGSQPARAAMSDPLIEGAKLCTALFPQEESRYGTPPHLLAAISSTETGRWHKRLGLPLPWPWTVNIEGKGYYLDNKAEAIAKVQQAMANGSRSIDVGCMQVNLKHHPSAFANLNEAFEPRTNVAYAARYLRTHFDSSRSWIEATSDYHSKTPVYGRAYVQRVETAWNRIIGKVRNARSDRGMDVAAYSANPSRREWDKADVLANANSVPDAAPQSAAQKNRRMAQVRTGSPRNSVRVIQVRNRMDAGTREAGVMVVRPSTNRNPNEASSAPETETAKRGEFFVLDRDGGNKPHTLAAATPARAGVSNANNGGAKFVFAD